MGVEAVQKSIIFSVLGVFDRPLITRRRRPSLVAYDLSAMDKTREFALEAIPPARNTGVSQTAKIADIS
jgi:hypothetical protein